MTFLCGHSKNPIAKSVFKVTCRSQFCDPLNKCMRPNGTRKCGSRTVYCTPPGCHKLLHTLCLNDIFVWPQQKSNCEKCVQSDLQVAVLRSIEQMYETKWYQKVWLSNGVLYASGLSHVASHAVFE